jgi:chemotaxis protein MotD
MTAAVGPAIANPIAPTTGRAFRETEAPQGGFDEALDSLVVRSGSQSPGEKEPKIDRWHRHVIGNDPAPGRTNDATLLKQAPPPEAEAELVEAAADDDLVAAPTTEPGDTELVDKVADDAGQDTSFPVQIKAEHAISAMMATAPTKQHGLPETAAGQIAPGTPAKQSAADAPARPIETQMAPTAETLTASASATTLPPTDDGVTMQPASGAADQRHVRVGVENKAVGETGKPAKLPDSGGNYDLHIAPAQTEAGTADDGSDQPRPGTRDQRSAAPEARRFEPLPVAAKVTVVSQQAAPAPVAAPILTANAAAIVSAIDAAQRPMSSPSLLVHISVQPMRSLKIQLHPAELGVVTANLKAAGEQLSVELSVESREAYHRLSADSDAIVKSLRSLGYDIDHVSILQPQIAATAVARPDAGTGTGSFARDQSSFQPGGSSDSGGRFGGQANGRGEGGDAQRGGEAQQAYRDRTGGDLYI